MLLSYAPVSFAFFVNYCGVHVFVHFNFYNFYQEALEACCILLLNSSDRVSSSWAERLVGSRQFDTSMEWTDFGSLLSGCVYRQPRIGGNL